MLEKKRGIQVRLRRLVARMPVPQAHRFCSMRNPFARIFMLVAAVIILMCMTLQSNTVAHRTRVLRTADRMAAVSSQAPLEVDRVTPIVNGSDFDAPLSTHIMNCDVNAEHLRHMKENYALGDELEYFKRYVRFTRQPVERFRHTQLQQSLVPNGHRGFKMVDLADDDSSQTCDDPLEVPVTQSRFPGTVDLSDFMFAISTTYGRLNDPESSPIKEWAFWLTDSNGHSNGGKLLLQLIDASNTELEDITDRLARAGIDADVAHSDHRLEMAVRYLGLVPTLYNHPEARFKKWLVLCDDDTYFPAMHSLIDRFQEFDHHKAMYIGTLSEDVGALERHGSQAFGGAGVFLSLPLAKHVSKIYSTCRTKNKIRESDSGWGPQGDIILRKCIYENTNVRLTQLWDLWQLDLYGDPAGFYEGGIKPFSVHHFKGGGWHHAYPFQTSKIAHACGEDCSYQRFVTSDNFVISNGFSVAQYPEGIDFDLDQFEGTFFAAPENRGWNLDFMYGPQRPSLLGTGKKIAWELRESHNHEDGSVSQVYIRKRDDDRWTKNGKPMKTRDGVIELVWIPS